MEATEKKRLKTLSDVTPKDVENLFAKHANKLHEKVDDTRDAYFGFIFPINRADFRAVAVALNIDESTGRLLYKGGTAFSTFMPKGRKGARQITNHIVGSSILALRGRDLDNGLDVVTDKTLAEYIQKYEGTALEIAEARTSWFGRIYFPAAAFSNALAVFGAKVTPDTFFDLAVQYGYGNVAGERKTIRGDFGIGVWLALLGNV